MSVDRLVKILHRLSNRNSVHVAKSKYIRHVRIQDIDVQIQNRKATDGYTLEPLMKDNNFWLTVENLKIFGWR